MAATVPAVQFDEGASAAPNLTKGYSGDQCDPSRVPANARRDRCTWEHDLHFFMRTVESNAAIYGGPGYDRDRLAPVVGL